jgi:hypothetical protein
MHGRSKYADETDDADTEHGLFTKIAEDVVVFAICCYLIKLGVSYLVSVKVPLIIISAILIILAIIYRVYRKREHDDY